MTSRQLDSLTSFFFRQRCADEHIAGRRTITWGQARTWWHAARERARLHNTALEVMEAVGENIIWEAKKWGWQPPHEVR